MSNLGHAPEQDEEGSGGLDREYALDLASFLLRAPRRHPWHSVVALVAGLLITALVATGLPRVYTADTRILAQRNLVIPLLGNPRRPVPTDSDAPTRAANEAVLRRDNLVGIMRETHLTERWEDGLPWAIKLKNALLARIGGPLSEDTKQRALIGMLERKIQVNTDGGTIKISAAWHEPAMAYLLVKSAAENFLKDRASAETAAITEAIGILEEEATRQRDVIQTGLAAVEMAVLAAPQAAPSASLLRAAPRAEPSSDHAEIAAELEVKRRAIQEITEARQRRLADLRAQLAQMQVTYAPQHPFVLALEEKIRQESREPPELAALNQAQTELLERAKSAEPRRAPSPAAPAPGLPADTKPAVDPPGVTAARTKLTAAVQKYIELMDRIDSARIERETTQAAFKFRYSVVQPPEQPLRPTKPNVLLIVLAGVGLSLTLAITAAATRDFRSDRFIEPWQVRRRLPLPLLAEVKQP